MTEHTEQWALQPGESVDAGALSLALNPLPADEVRDGAPGAGSVDLDVGPGVALGVWEMTRGTAVDIEVDECFVVLSGRARVTITGVGEASEQVMELAAGTIGRLSAGMQTEWVVYEDLRKVYLTPIRP